MLKYLFIGKIFLFYRAKAMVKKYNFPVNYKNLILVDSPQNTN